MASIDKQIEIVKVLQRVFDNCSESEEVVGTDPDGGDYYENRLNVFDICKAIENTLDDLVNEKLRVEQ